MAFGSRRGFTREKEAEAMDDSTFWWVAAGLAVAAELITGTFYLLMVAIGLAAAALLAVTGIAKATQIAVAALVGGGAVLVLRWARSRSAQAPQAQANPDIHLDIGQTVHIAQWDADGSAQVHYRGANWTAIHRAGVTPVAGEHRVAEVIGSRLLVDKV
jgi:membrane protein implicated in regulation of membrane protease activity